MPRKKKKSPAESLGDVIVEAMLNKKAKDPVVINFSKISNSICDLFVVCHSTSRPHSEAIADGIILEVKKNTGQIPWHREGFENAEWILIDYGDTIVHIFQESTRAFYNLEKLWADADITKVETSE